MDVIIIESKSLLKLKELQRKLFEFLICSE